VLPVIALSTLPAAFIARVTRASMLEVLTQDYIRTAGAKGLSKLTVIRRHGLKNAMIPVLTVMGPYAAILITGSFIVENIFSIPGVGRAFVDAVLRRDYAMIMGSTLFYAAIIAFANLVVDILYAAVDPRIRYR
jgi:oligopeptide transport system permease protein